MRVAYRESLAETAEQELELEKTIGGAHMYTKLKFRVESTLEETDPTQLQRDKFEANNSEAGGLDIDFSSLGQN